MIEKIILLLGQAFMEYFTSLTIVPNNHTGKYACDGRTDDRIMEIWSMNMNVGDKTLFHILPRNGNCPESYIEAEFEGDAIGQYCDENNLTLLKCRMFGFDAVPANFLSEPGYFSVTEINKP